MKRFVGLALLLALPASSHAQFNQTAPSPFIPPLPRPRVTPYLGLLRGGNPAANYYLTVQPEVRRGIESRILGQTLSVDALAPRDMRLSAEAAELTLIPIQPQSGHAAGFNLTAPYFQFPSQPRTFIPFGGQPPAPLPPERKK